MLKEQYIDKTRVAVFGKVSPAVFCQGFWVWSAELCLTTIRFLLSH